MGSRVYIGVRGCIYIYISIYIYIYILGFCRDNGKETGNYYVVIRYMLGL